MEIIATSSCPPNVTSPLSVSGSSTIINTFGNNRGPMLYSTFDSSSIYLALNPQANPLYFFTSSFTNSDQGWVYKYDQSNYTLDLGTFANNVTSSLIGTDLNKGPINLFFLTGSVDGDLIFGGRLGNSDGLGNIAAIKTDGTQAPTFIAEITGSMYSNLTNTGFQSFAATDNYLYTGTQDTAIPSTDSKHLQRIRLDSVTYDSGFSTAAGGDFRCDPKTGARVNSGSVVFGGSLSGSYSSLTFVSESASGGTGYNFRASSGFFENDFGLGRIRDLKVHNEKVYVAGDFNKYNVSGVTGSISGYAKFDLDGALDLTGFATSSQYLREVLSIGVQSDGKIIIGSGIQSNWTTDASYENIPGFNLGYYPGALIRLNTDGTFDDTFNYPNVVGGQYTKYSGSSPTEVLLSTGSISSIEVLPDDRLVVMGQFAGYYDSASYNEVSGLRGMVVLESNGGLISTEAI